MRRCSWSVIGLATTFSVAGFSGCTPTVSCDSGWCGTVVVASAPARSLFPPLAQLDVELGIADLLFSKLADVGPSFNTVGDTDFVPGLATSWHFEDSLTISISLNPLSRWQDGTRVAATDVVHTFNIYQDPVVNALARSRLQAIESVTARDSVTVVFRFRDYYPEQFYDAVSHVHILPRHLLESATPEDLGTHEYALNPIGSGPYRLVQWIPGESVELAADSNHFLGRPGVPRIIWRTVAGATAGVDELIANRADFLHIVAEPADLERIDNSPHLRLSEYASNTFNLISFNLRDPEDPNRPHPLFGDRALRRAIVMSVNRPALIQSVLGPYGMPCVGPVTPALWIWDDQLTDALPFDSAAARAALRDLGWSDSDGDGVLDRHGRPLEFDLLLPPNQIRARGALVLQDQLGRMGIQMNIEDRDWPAFFNGQETGQFDAAYNSLGQDPSPAALATDWTEEGFNEFNYGKYSNAEYTRLVRDARDDPDRNESLAKWHAALRIINEDAPAIWLYVPRKFAAVHERFDHVLISPYQPWVGLPQLRVQLSRLIERDLFGAN
ncbi:ABC transporter substrate-binding protein [Gemmatimonadota bacterium]